MIPLTLCLYIRFFLHSTTLSNKHTPFPLTGKIIKSKLHHHRSSLSNPSTSSPIPSQPIILSPNCTYPSLVLIQPIILFPNCIHPSSVPVPHPTYNPPHHSIYPFLVPIQPIILSPNSTYPSPVPHRTVHSAVHFRRAGRE